MSNIIIEHEFDPMTGRDRVLIKTPFGHVMLHCDVPEDDRFKELRISVESINGYAIDDEFATTVLVVKKPEE